MIQELLESEMDETLDATKSERTGNRLGYRSGYYNRNLITRVGKMELRIPQDRQGRFSTELFERFSRSEKALCSAIIEMYVQGVSTRKVKHIAEQLCGHNFSASSVSRLTVKMDEQLKHFYERPITHNYPYVILDARYENVRENGIISKKAVLVALGINELGHREVLCVEVAQHESHESWKQFLLGLKRRGLKGVKLVISDAHDGLKRAVNEVYVEAYWQRCYVHLLRNALTHLPKNHEPKCFEELKELFACKDVKEARQQLQNWIAKWENKYPKACDWAELNLEESLPFICSLKYTVYVFALAI